MRYFTFKVSVVLFVVFSLSITVLGERIYSLTEDTKQSKTGEITFFVRFPKGRAWNPEDANSDTPCVRGVMAVCTWMKEPKKLKGSIKAKGLFSDFVTFADNHDLALITWTNPEGYKIGISGDEMSVSEYKADKRVSDRRAQDWENGFRRFCGKYNLPEKNILLFGISGGAQTAHRLAMRLPEYFFAIHIHINSSYDCVNDAGKTILWLVTTGTREYGYPAGIRFYESARKKGYQMIFRSEENLGHSTSKATYRLSLAFFEYCVRYLPDARTSERKMMPDEQFLMMKSPAYIGDHLNGVAFTPDVASKYMDPMVMVSLPTTEIAKAWGTILDNK